MADVMNDPHATGFLQVKTSKGWRFVFCENGGVVLTTDNVDTALLGQDYMHFYQKYAGTDFRVVSRESVGFPPLKHPFSE